MAVGANFYLTDGSEYDARVSEITQHSKGDEIVSDMWQPTRHFYIETGGKRRQESKVAEMANSKSTQTEWVSEYTNLKNVASLALTAAKHLGLIDNDAPGAVGGYTQLTAEEKAALSFEGVAEIGRPHGDPGKQAKTIRAALKLQGTTVSEMSEAQIKHLEGQAASNVVRQALIDDFARRPEVIESERRLAEFNTNRNRITV